MSKDKETLQKKIKGWVLNLHAGKYSVLRKVIFFFSILSEDAKSFSDTLK